MFRKILKTVVVFILALSMLAVPAFADYGTITGSGVNFREGPGTGYNVIDCLPKGTVVAVNGLYDGSWYSITYNGRTGYVSSGYISIGSTSSAGTQTSSGISQGVIIIGQGYSSTASEEEEVTSTPVSTPAPTPTPTPTPVPTATPQVTYGSSGGTIIIGGQGYYSVSTQEGSSSRSADSSEQESSSQTESSAQTGSTSSNTSGIRTGVITGDYVRFRTGPSTTYSIINTYNKNTQAVILDVSGDWTRCTIDGTTGFVYSKYIQENTTAAVSAAASATATTSEITVTEAEVKEASETVAANSKAGYISGNNVRFRSGASLSSDIIGEFFFGNAVSITGVSGDWTAVSADGKSGYVYSQYVKEGTYTVQSTSESTDTSAASTQLASGSGALVAAYACTFVGTPYCWGGTDPSTGFDCSGFVYYVYKQFGIELNRVAADQAQNGTAVDASNLQPGDVLCFYSSGTYIGHSGIYIGDGKFVHAASSTTGVIITSLAGNYTSRGFVARRIIS